MTTKSKAWLIGAPLVLAGVILSWSFKRATLYQCTACFAENPGRCKTHKETSDEFSENEATVQRLAKFDLCWDDDAHVREACDDLPPERFNITCASWRQWVPKHYSNPFVVH